MLRTVGDILENVPFLARVRRNHALEHATVHMLSRRVPGLRVAGYSTDGGFLLIGTLSTDQVEAAAEEALARLRRGEHHWAVHPNCGTSLLTTGVMAAMASSFSVRLTQRAEDRPLRLSTSLLLTIIALIVARPLGLNLQREVTTEACMGGLSITHVRRLTKTPTVHWVGTTLP